MSTSNLSKNFRLLVVAGILMMFSAACGKSSVGPTPDPGPADGMVTFIWTAQAGTDCSKTVNPQALGARRAALTAYLPPPYKGSALGVWMQPVGVGPLGEGGSWMITVKVPASTQTNMRWDVGVFDECLSNNTEILNHQGIGISAQSGTGAPVKLFDVLGGPASFAYHPPNQIVP